MKKQVFEEIVLLVSIVKWMSLAALIGILVGSLAALFLYLLELGLNHWRWQYAWFFWFIPLALVVSSLLMKYLAPAGEGHGTEQVIEAVHKRSGRMNVVQIPVKLLATLITLTAGGSAGKEGPCAVLGAGVGSLASDCLRLEDRDRKKVTICGISAGFAAVFGTPVAGALFAVEVLVLGMVFQEVLLPSLVSSVIGFQTTKYLGQVYHYSYIPIEEFSPLLFLQAAGAGLFLAMVGYLFIELLRLAGFLGRKFRERRIWRALLGGLILVAVAGGISTDFCGLGLPIINQATAGEKMPLTWFLWKMFTTATTMAAGGVGGVLTPITFVGATAGNAFAQVFQLDPAVFAGIGLVALLAGCTNTPIASTVMAIELFGADISAYAAIACVVCYIAIGHRSVYPTQILGAAKSPSLMPPLMRSLDRVEEVEVEPGARRKLTRVEGVFRYGRRWLRRGVRKFRK